MRTTCPLDCYDACSVIYDGKKLSGDKEHTFTNGHLCPNLHHYLNEPRIQNARFNGKEITNEEALNILYEKLKDSHDKKTLLFKSSGNFGYMQNITKEFFSKYGSTFTSGNLCDSGGEAGVIEGRGKNYSLTPSQIKKSKVVVVWGRNIDSTNSHLLEIIKDKILIVIDPVKTSLAKKADIHLQIKPRSDFELAMLFCRFAYMEQMEDEEWIAKHGSDFDYFLNFFRSYTVNQLLDSTEVVIEDFLTALMLIKDTPTSFLVGNGVSKYTNSNEILRAIDSFVAMLGYFGKEGCGVGFLGNSTLGYELPFSNYNVKTTPMATVDFGEFDLVFIQGANPANQMPNTNQVFDGLKKSKFVVYYGLFENQTSALADLVIPSVNFLAKQDVRFSYSHEFVGVMPKLKEEEFGVSEYNLTKYLLARFDYQNLEPKSKYIEKIIESNSNFENHYITSKSYDTLPYSEEDFHFEFIDDCEDDSELKDKEGLYLITPKYKYSLNSQFKTDSFVYINPSLGYQDSEDVKISSEYGELTLKVKISDDLREDSIMIYSGVDGVNKLTPSFLSLEGDGACFQEIKVKIERA